jgi:hypothetical protein
VPRRCHHPDRPRHSYDLRCALRRSASPAYSNEGRAFYCGDHMKTCLGCKHANWKRTTAGKLHPSGIGRCEYEVKIPVLPLSMTWILNQVPLGGNIERHKNFLDHCPCYERAT